MIYPAIMIRIFSVENRHVFSYRFTNRSIYFRAGGILVLKHHFICGNHFILIEIAAHGHCRHDQE